MCGIFGIVTIKSDSDLEQAISRAVNSLAHRGPDDYGIEFLQRLEAADGITVAFGHRRLSILDLSFAGHQPMIDPITGDAITYNGEVYNFRQVRHELERRGLSFKSESDTEVILKGFGLLGEKAIDDWRGMFAFGFWDASEKSLLLVRDRLGIKPLYYYFDGCNFIFASEIRALLATGLVPRRLSHAALDGYLAYGSIQEPLTIVDNVYEVLPGHILSFKDGWIDSRPYWQIESAPVAESELDEEEMCSELHELLLDSVRLRLVSDVPVGAFLSGGIDSSAVVSLMRRATTGDIRTFSVCFSEEEFSEHAYAERVADRFETDHTPVLVTEDEILSMLPAALKAMDQPSIDGINTWIVSNATARAGLKVAVSGLGGDELFAGYKYFRTVERDEYLRTQVNNVPAGLRRVAATAISSIATGHRAGKLSALLRSNHLGEHAVRLHRQLFTSDQRRWLLDKRIGDAGDQELLETWQNMQLGNCRDAEPVNQASALDMGGYMSNTLLRDTDSMSMAHGLEVRVPLIDYLAVEKMMLIPGRYKLGNDFPKRLLVKAVGDLPDEIVHRPKRGFELPYRLWLQGALRERVDSAVNSSNLSGIFKKKSMESLWRGFLQGRITWSRIWALVVLDEWISNNL